MTFVKISNFFKILCTVFELTCSLILYLDAILICSSSLKETFHEETARILFVLPPVREFFEKMSSENSESIAPPTSDNAGETDVPVTQQEVAAAVDLLEGNEEVKKESNKIETNASKGDEKVKKESNEIETNASKGDEEEKKKSDDLEKIISLASEIAITCIRLY